jgi:hypothetical protein
MVMDNLSNLNNQPVSESLVPKKSKKLTPLKIFFLALLAVIVVAIIIFFKLPRIMYCTDGSQCSSGICKAVLTAEQDSQLKAASMVNGKPAMNTITIQGAHGKCLPKGENGCVTEVKHGEVSNMQMCFM